MAKVLVIRKTDKTIHKAPLANKAVLTAHNNRLPAGKKWVIEEMEEDEAAKLPFIDDAYVTAAEATNKLKAIEKSVEQKDSKIAELEAKLAALGNPGQLTAVDAIAKIKAATTKEQVLAILGNDERKTVKDAADIAIASFE